MSLLVTGTVGIDSVITPHGRATDVLGGSATYFSMAAALFTRVRLVAVVGDDFPAAFRDHLRSSRREALLAFRSLFDTAIDRMDAPKKARARKIKAE